MQVHPAVSRSTPYQQNAHPSAPSGNQSSHVAADPSEAPEPAGVAIAEPAVSVVFLMLVHQDIDNAELPAVSEPEVCEAYLRLDPPQAAQQQHQHQRAGRQCSAPPPGLQDEEEQQPGSYRLQLPGSYPAHQRQASHQGPQGAFQPWRNDGPAAGAAAGTWGQGYGGAHDRAGWQRGGYDYPRDLQYDQYDRYPKQYRQYVPRDAAGYGRYAGRRGDPYGPPPQQQQQQQQQLEPPGYLDGYPYAAGPRGYGSRPLYTDRGPVAADFGSTYRQDYPGRQCDDRQYEDPRYRAPQYADGPLQQQQQQQRGYSPPPRMLPPHQHQGLHEEPEQRRRQERDPRFGQQQQQQQHEDGPTAGGGGVGGSRGA